MEGIEKKNRSNVKENFVIESRSEKDQVLNDSKLDNLFKWIVLSKEERSFAMSRQKKVSWITTSGLVFMAGYYFHILALGKMALMGLFGYVIYKRNAISGRVIEENNQMKSIEQQVGLENGQKIVPRAAFDQSQIMFIKKETYLVCTYLEEKLVKMAMVILLLSACDTLNHYSLFSSKSVLELGSHVGIGYTFFCERGLLISKILQDLPPLSPSRSKQLTIETFQTKPRTLPLSESLDCFRIWNVVQSPEHPIDSDTQPAQLVEEQREPSSFVLDVPIEEEVKSVPSDPINGKDLLIHLTVSSKKPFCAQKVESPIHPLHQKVFDRRQAVCPSSPDFSDWEVMEGHR